MGVFFFYKNTILFYFITFKNIEQTNGNLRLIGAQQNTYLALNDNGTCCIISAKNLKSSILHIKYSTSSTVLNETNISYNKSSFRSKL